MKGKERETRAFAGSATESRVFAREKDRKSKSV
jgi:hypothetical protein